MKQIVIRPLLTEKTVSQTAGGWYTFVVANDAKKRQIADRIADKYKVNVVEVRTARMHGKVRRAGRKQRTVAKSDWKKALVRLPQGQKIDAFEASTQEAHA